MPVSLSSIRDLLLPGLRGVEGDYRDIPAQYPHIFEKGTSKMALERTASMRYLPLAQIKTEGGQTNFDQAAGERFIYNQEHIEVALGYAITRKAIDDNLYKSQFNPSNLGLVKSFNQFKEITAANVLNNGATYQTAVGADGVALFSTAHPTDYGNVANTPTTQVSLNESTMHAGLITVRQFRDNAGLKQQARGRKLAVPIQLEYVASRLFKTELRPGTADNDVNATLATGALPDGYIVLDYLTSAFAWFILTDVGGLLHLERIPFETDMQVDFSTDNLLVKGYERYSFGYKDWRAGYASFPTS